MFKNLNIFLTFAQNIGCGYTLEPPHRGGEAVLSSTHNLCVGAKIRKLCIPLLPPVLLYKIWIRGYTLHGHIFVMLDILVAAPVAGWLRSLTSVLLIIRSSHRCGFAPRTGHESHVGQAKFCLRVCQVVFPPEYSGFRPTYRLIRLDMREKA